MSASVSLFEKDRSKKASQDSPSKSNSEGYKENSSSIQLQSFQDKADELVGGESQNNTTQLKEKANNTGLPDQLKAGVEQLSGHSLDDVKVHYNSSKPAQLKAHAYAEGNQIHLAQGQEKHLGHEAWHVVQQKENRVSPTKQINGFGVNDNPSLEKEADTMGAKAASGSYSEKPNFQLKSVINSATSVQGVLQREPKEETKQSEKEDKTQESEENGSKSIGKLGEVKTDPETLDKIEENEDSIFSFLNLFGSRTKELESIDSKEEETIDALGTQNEKKFGALDAIKKAAGGLWWLFKAAGGQFIADLMNYFTRTQQVKKFNAKSDVVTEAAYGAKKAQGGADRMYSQTIKSLLDLAFSLFSMFTGAVAPIISIAKTALTVIYSLSRKGLKKAYQIIFGVKKKEMAKKLVDGSESNGEYASLLESFNLKNLNKKGDIGTQISVLRGKTKIEKGYLWGETRTGGIEDLYKEVEDLLNTETEFY